MSFSFSPVGVSFTGPPVASATAKSEIMGLFSGLVVPDKHFPVGPIPEEGVKDYSIERSSAESCFMVTEIVTYQDGSCRQIVIEVDCMVGNVSVRSCVRVEADGSRSPLGALFEPYDLVARALLFSGLIFEGDKDSLKRKLECSFESNSQFDLKEIGLPSAPLGQLGIAVSNSNTMLAPGFVSINSNAFPIIPVLGGIMNPGNSVGPQQAQGFLDKIFANDKGSAADTPVIVSKAP